MPKTFYISDTHFGHKNIINLDDRPFADVHEMNNTIINNWNFVVSQEDTVYHLGDFSYGTTEEWNEVLNNLNGNIVLIKGNHDGKKLKSDVRYRFQEIRDYKEITDNGRRVILCHYPILTYKSSYNPNVYMLFGHVHNNTKESRMVETWIKCLRRSEKGDGNNLGQLYNVGCMMPWMNYTPRTLDEITKGENEWNTGLGLLRK